MVGSIQSWRVPAFKNVSLIDLPPTVPIATNRKEKRCRQSQDELGLSTRKEKKKTHAKSCHRHTGTTFIKLRDKINFLLYFFFFKFLSFFVREYRSIFLFLFFCFRWGQRWMTNRKVIARTRDYSANNEMEMIVHHIINSFGKSCPAKTKNNKHIQK